ncbi:MAG: hypothetical protein LBJ12_08510 [Oscillospiraceae bacterium]|jgi:hypothetical protein|nr:hypothetical protein [Oscillospiraceae bacterium]
MPDLTLYSYENVIEGWFGLYLCSDDTKKKYDEFKRLAESGEKLTGKAKEKYIDLYSALIKTDLISSVTRLNLRKELEDDELYVLCREN